MRRFSNFIPVSIVAVLLLAISLPTSAATRSKKSSGAKKQSQTESVDPVPSQPVLGPDGVPLVKAASVVVVDAKTGHILYTKNPDQHRPPASTQKLLTALVITETGNLDKLVRVEAEDTNAEPVKLGFKPGDVYTRRALLEVLLVHSMNDVARCLARDNAGSIEAFAAKMNRKAAELGVVDSHFVNPNGLPAPGQFSTARDMARIALAAYSNHTLRSIVSTKSLFFRYADGHVREFKNTNRVLLNYPYCNGMKTGYTEEAGKCLIASGSYGGRDIIAVVLGDTVRSIWKDAYLLLAWGFSS